VRYHVRGIEWGDGCNGRRQGTEFVGTWRGWWQAHRPGSVVMITCRLHAGMQLGVR
jgi:hypothetical protein